MTTTTDEMKTKHSNISCSMIKPCARNGFGFRKPFKQFIQDTIGKPIAQPIVRINNIFVRHYPFHSSVRTAKQTAQIIYSPVGTVCPSVRNSYSSVRTADQTVQIIIHPFERLGKPFERFKDRSLTVHHPFVFAVQTVFR